MAGNIFLGIQRLSNNNNKKTGEFQVRLFGFFFFLLCGQIFTSTLFVHFFHIIKGTLESFFFLRLLVDPNNTQSWCWQGGGGGLP